MDNELAKPTTWAASRKPHLRGGMTKQLDSYNKETTLCFFQVRNPVTSCLHATLWFLEVSQRLFCAPASTGPLSPCSHQLCQLQCKAGCPVSDSLGTKSRKGLAVTLLSWYSLQPGWISGRATYMKHGSLND